MKSFYFVTLFFLAFLVPVTFVRAAEVTLTPSHDTTVKKSAPDSSFSDAPSLDALYDGGMDYFNAPQELYEAMFKFDLSSIAEGQYITSASLILTTYGESTYGFGDIRLRRALSDWNDQTTWNTKPSYGDESDATLEITQNQFPPSIDITHLVQDWYTNTIPNYGLVMRPYGDGDYQKGIYTADDAHVSSKEGPNPPRLIITYSDTPPPSPSVSPSSGTSAGSDAAKPGLTNNEPGTSTGSGNGESSSSSDQLTQDSPFIAEEFHPCQSDIRSIRSKIFATEAEIMIETTTLKRLDIYYAPVSHVDPPGATGKFATNVTADSQKIEETQTNSRHKITLAPLQSETKYYFSIVGDNMQDCEHSFQTISSIPNVRGTAGLLRNNPENDSMQNPFSRLTRALSEALTQGRPVSPLVKSSMGLLVASLLTLGPATATALVAAYRAVRQLPNNIRMRFLPRKKRVTWGRVIMSTNSRGIGGALVSLFDIKTGRLVDRTVSDALGIYGFYADPGKYRLAVTRSGYNFPSKLMPYGYQGTAFTVESINGTIALDVPMDLSEYADDIYQSFSWFIYVLAIFRRPLIALSLVVSLIAFISTPMVLSFMMLAIITYLTWREGKRWYYVQCRLSSVDKKNTPLPYVQIIIRSKEKIERRLTNNRGQTYIEIPQGSYEVIMATLPVSDRLEIQEAHIQINVSFRLGIQDIKLALP
jgi:hypothetical protein